MDSANSSTFEYPLVIRKVMKEIVISAPDLGYWKSIPIIEIEQPLETAKSSKNEKVIVLEENFLRQVTEGLKEAWLEIDDHRRNKKWVPTPSTFKQSLQKNEKDFTLPEFTAELSKFISISENTVRREITRGVIQCYQTEGGHRRIPFSELEIYLAKRRTKKDLISL
jgi:excisionase family DNA binding protein